MRQIIAATSKIVSRSQTATRNVTAASRAPGRALQCCLVAALVMPVLATAATENSVYYVATANDKLIRVEIARDPAFDMQGQPVLLTYSPYHSLDDLFSGNFMAVNDGLASRYNPMGIARAAADVLGTRGSTGCWDYGGALEQQAGIDVVKFLAGKIPDRHGEYITWTNGKVGMTGVSYEGTTASMVAARGVDVPELVAIVPVAAISHWYGYSYHEGVRYFLNSESPTDEGFDTPLAFDHGFGDTVHPDNPNTVPARAAECDALEHEQQGYSRSPDYGPFWAERDYLLTGADYRAATLIVHGWNDYNVKQDEAILLWEAIEVDDPATPEIEGVPDKRLWMTQSRHANGSGPGYQALVDAWWKAWLLDDADAHAYIETQPKVTTLGETTAGSAAWTPAATWPLPATTTVSYFLNRTYEQDYDPVNVPGPGTGEVGELSAENRWEGPLEGRPGSYGLTSSWLDTGLATEELSRHDPWSNEGNAGPGPGGQGYYSLAFQTEVLPAAMQISGRVVLDGVFRFAQPAGATLTPILVDIDPGDAYKTIQRGFLNVDYRDGLSTADAAAPETWVDADVSFLPEDYTVPAGHRIGLILQSSNAVWALPGNPAGLSTVLLGPVDGVTETGTRLHLPVVAPDLDGDGVADSDDNCPQVANNDQSDVDGDLVGDACDNCLLEANPDQCNTNAGSGPGLDQIGNVCDADLDNNGIVNSFDLTIMRDEFGASGANDADITCNGIVNTFDLTELRNDFGQAPGPSGLP